ncbi:MAG: hypothetical protein AMXMBFR58_05220 [Phycisphaerae bacterium]|nr:hypothetical protein [Phycisphaerales bacterium]MCK6477531.1 hypothetical protein [Phycisphaerales bacterium]
MTESSPTILTTTINRGWMTKMVIIALFMCAFGLWGLYDALVAYPARGERAASFYQKEYLTLLENRQDGSLLTRSSVSDPQAEYQALSQKREGNTLAEEELPKLLWLEQLKLIGRLKPEHTTLTDPRTTLEDLKARWNTSQSSSPQELSWYDIPAQWVIMAVGVGVGLYLLGLIAVVRRTKYQWEPQSQRLHLPSGATLVPADIELFDKRKWDKFMIYLKIKPSHPQLGGREVELDLLRHSPLEDWVLAMERTAFPESTEEPQTPAEPTPPAPTPTA